MYGHSGFGAWVRGLAQQALRSCGLTYLMSY